MADDLATVLDMVLACRRIARFLTGVDEPTFLASEEKHWAVVSQLSIVGESVRRLSTPFRDARPHVPWRQIAGMRDRLIHGYDKINWSLVWLTATQEVPKLLAELEPLIPSLEGNANDATSPG
jgi:uncharacterized protein with HEPN domain